jgi:hypothetical protein
MLIQKKNGRHHQESRFGGFIQKNKKIIDWKFYETLNEIFKMKFLAIFIDKETIWDMSFWRLRKSKIFLKFPGPAFTALSTEGCQWFATKISFDLTNLRWLPGFKTKEKQMIDEEAVKARVRMDIGCSSLSLVADDSGSGDRGETQVKEFFFSGAGRGLFAGFPKFWKSLLELFPNF